jgi:hypothetical protein
MHEAIMGGSKHPGGRRSRKGPDDADGSNAGLNQSKTVDDKRL